jgi:membrane protease YdiL (CAAX protease family)
MPPDAIAVFDAAMAFMLFFIVPPTVTAIVQFAAAPPPAMHVSILALLAGFVAVVLYWLARGRPIPLAPRPGWALGCYAVFMVFWLPFAFWLYPYLVRALGYEFLPQQMLTFLVDRPAGWMFWLAVFTACVAAPLGEELLFRGFLYRPLELRWGPWCAILCTSLLFGGLHEVSVALPITLLGLLFAFLRHRSGGVASSILVHLVHNTITIGLVVAYPDLMNLYDK